ncbi:MAG: transposase [Myxococcaceae bacterium]
MDPETAAEWISVRAPPKWRHGSALQLTPHFHVLLPEAVFEEAPQGGPDAQAARSHPLPPPDDAEVERLLRRVALRVVALLRKQGKLDPVACADALDALRARAAQQRLPLGEAPSRPKPRCAFLDGFSLHANTWVHENDRDNLVRLCGYGARGPLCLERLSRLPDGRLAYRMKRPSASGQNSSAPAENAVLCPERRFPRYGDPPRALPPRWHGRHLRAGSRLLARKGRLFILIPRSSRT